MQIILHTLATVLFSIRNFFFLPLFLLIGTNHQAVEKQSDSRAMENDLSFLYAPAIQFNPEYTDYLERKIDSLLQRRGFNGSVMLAHQGQAVYNKSFGISRFSDRREFSDSENVFQLASVGKQFTAHSVLMLFERGLINLDDPVVMHMDGFPYEDITIRHLLNHTSGLQNYFYVIENYWKKDYLPEHKDMLELFVSRNLPLNFTPGRRFSYSNTGYAFLAYLVECVSGETFSAFVKNNIFEPLRMKNSFVFHPSMDMNELIDQKNITPGYERNGRRLREIPVDFVDGITGDKGIFSCTEDLLKWDNALENNTLISEATREIAFESGQLRNGHRINYGFGYRLRPAQNIVYHNGWWRGFRTAYVRLPENTLIVILNNTNASIIGLDNQLRSIMNRCPIPIFEEKENNHILAQY